MNKECNLLGVRENAHTFQFLLPQMDTCQVFLCSAEQIITELLWKRNGGSVKDQEGHWQVCRSQRHSLSVCVIQGVQQELLQEMQLSNCEVLVCVAVCAETSLW